MKKLLIIFLLISGYAYGQHAPGYTQRNTKDEVIATKSDSATLIPAFERQRLSNQAAARAGNIIIDSVRRHMSFSPGGGVLIRLRDTTEAAGANGANGTTKSGDSILLGGTLWKNTAIALGGNDLSHTGIGHVIIGDAPYIGTSTAKLQVNNHPRTPLLNVGNIPANDISIILANRDTLTAANLSSQFPYLLVSQRQLYITENGLTITSKIGAQIGTSISAKDSVYVYTQGGDLMYGLKGIMNYGKISGQTSRTVIQAGQVDFDAVPALQGGGSTFGSTSSTNNVRVRGYIAMVGSFFNVTNANDTIDNLIHFLPSGYNSNGGHILKQYQLYATAIPSDTNYFLFQKYKYHIYNVLAAPTSFGDSLNTGPTEAVEIKGHIKIVDGSQANGYVLTSDANGKATWAAASGGGGSGTVTSVAAGYGTAFTTITSTGSVIVDTFSMATRARVQKGIDSVRALITTGITGSIAANQVAVGSGTNTIAGSSALTYDGTIFTLQAGSGTTEMDFKSQNGSFTTTAKYANSAVMTWNGPGTYLFWQNNNSLFEVADGQVEINQSLRNYDFHVNGDNDANLLWADASGDKVGIGQAVPPAKLSILSITEQLRTQYDASNYFSTTVSSTGVVTHDAVGSGHAFSFSDPLTATTLTASNLTPGTTPVAGTAGLLQDGLILASNNSTPTISNLVNVTGTPSAIKEQYLRVGSTVTVSGSLSVNVTTLATLTTIDLTIPIASTFSVAGSAAGTFTSAGGGSGVGNILGLSTTIQFSFTPTTSGNRTIYYHYTYRIE